MSLEALVELSFGILWLAIGASMLASPKRTEDLFDQAALPIARRWARMGIDWPLRDLPVHRVLFRVIFPMFSVVIGALLILSALF